MVSPAVFRKPILPIVGLRVVTTAALVVAIAGCGGGSGGGGSDTNDTNDTTSGVTQITGTAADGYLKNATVCLDVNENNQCDDSDPSTTSGSSGEFTIDGVTSTEKSKYAVVVEVEAGTTTDNGNSVSESYAISGVPGEHDMVSPVTTMVNAELQANPNMSREEAKAQVASQLGKDPQALLQDYVSGTNSDDDLHKVAQGIRKTVQDIEDQIKNDWGLNSLTASDKKLLRYAVTKVVSNHIAEIRGQIEGGEAPKDVTVKADAASKEGVQEEEAANELAETSSVVEMAKNHSLFVNLDGNGSAPLDFNQDDTLDIRLMYVSLDGFSPSAKIGNAISGDESVPTNEDEYYVEGNLDEVTQTDEGELKLTGKWGHSIYIMDAMTVDLSGKTYSLGSPVLSLDDDIQDTSSLAERDVSFEEGDKVFQWQVKFGKADPSNFDWDDVDSDVKGEWPVDADNVSQWVANHTSSDKSAHWNGRGDFRIYFDTASQTVFSASSGEAIADYEYQEANSTKYLLIDTYRSEKGHISFYKDGYIHMTDFDVTTHRENVHELNPTAAQKVLEAIKGWHKDQQ